MPNYTETPHMTIEEFLELLSELAGNWELRGPRIVWENEDVCPISAVAGFKFENEPDSEGLDMYDAKRLGLSDKDARDIIAASDSNPKRGRLFRLREKLLNACGLNGSSGSCFNESDYEEIDGDESVE